MYTLVFSCFKECFYTGIRFILNYKKKKNRHVNNNFQGKSSNKQKKKTVEHQFISF